jgi:hypothetical protein
MAQRPPQAPPAGPRMNKVIAPDQRADMVVEQMATIGGAATWDLKLAYEYGELIGRELRDQLYNASLGGGVGLMRESFGAKSSYACAVRYPASRTIGRPLPPQSRTSS